MSYEGFRQRIYGVIADRAGMNPQDFFDMPIDERRRIVEERAGEPMRFTGDSTRATVLSHAEVELMFDEALR
jgi:hypothetical protein